MANKAGEHPVLLDLLYVFMLLLLTIYLLTVESLMQLSLSVSDDTPSTGYRRRRRLQPPGDFVQPYVELVTAIEPVLVGPPSTGPFDS